MPELSEFFRHNVDHVVFVFLAFFVLMWFAVTTLLGRTSGWFELMKAFPDRLETALWSVSSQSGSLGQVSLRGILKISVCPSGLRFGLLRLFGPLSRNFFVPWGEIRVRRAERFIWRTAELQFGPVIKARLIIEADLADRLARNSQGNWPEPGPFPLRSRQELAVQAVKFWALRTAIAALFFSIVPRVLAPEANFPPIAVAILFPAVVFAIAGLVGYARRISS
jgi:hypothetical protein